MKYLILLLVPLLVGIAGAQVNDAIPESDTVKVTDARRSVRYNLNDYGSVKTWPDSAIDDWLNQSCKEIASQGVYVRRDTIITADTVVWYPMNADFMRVKNVFVRNTTDGRWYEVRSQKDSLQLPEIVKRDTIVTADSLVWYALNSDFMRVKNVFIRYTVDSTWRNLAAKNDSPAKSGITEPEAVRMDTIITTANTAWYALNTDIMRVREVIVKDEQDRWKGLNPRGGGIWARDTDAGINTYEIDGALLRIDKPLAQAGDSIIVIYNPYYQGVKGYDIDGDYLYLDKVHADSGDSVIIVYYAYVEGVKGYDVDSKHLRLDVSLADSGDSVIVVYSAYANDLTDSGGVVINLPYEYQIQVIQGAVERARMANREK